MEETAVWQGRPSQVKYLGTYVLGVASAVLILALLVALERALADRRVLVGAVLLLVPMVIMLRHWLEVRATGYELTSQRLLTRQGILTKQVDDLELYRVKDIIMVQPLLYRLFKVGNIILSTSDVSTPVIAMLAIPEAESVRELIRKNVEQRRDEKRVSEVDFARMHGMSS